MEQGVKPFKIKNYKFHLYGAFHGLDGGKLISEVWKCNNRFEAECDDDINNFFFFNVVG